jgi:hypothetical protein
MSMTAMRLYLDIETRAFYPTLSPVAEIKRAKFKRRDTEVFEVVFVKNRKPFVFDGEFSGTLGIKKFNDYAGGYLAFAPSWDVVTTENGTAYTFFVNFNTTQVESEFAALPALMQTVYAMLEVQWKNENSILPEVYSSVTLPITIHNDVIRGDEGTPSIAYDGKATQAEAEAGTNNEKWMTPLRTSQAIAALGGVTTTYSNTAPLTPLNGSRWVDTTTFRAYDFFNGAWIEIAT